MTASLPEAIDHALAAVSESTCQAFERYAVALAEEVTRALRSHPDHQQLLGTAPYQSIRLLQLAHATAFQRMLRARSADALLDEIVLECRRALGSGIAPAYMQRALVEWADAISRQLELAAAEQLAEIYNTLSSITWWLLYQALMPADRHLTPVGMARWYHRYIDALLMPDAAAAIQLTRAFVTHTDRIPAWWEQIIQPVLYLIGRLWMGGYISIAEEHRATAIVLRSISASYPLILDVPHIRGSVVVTTTPSELHMIGPRILADLLELDGWDVHVTGAGMPIASIAQFVAETRPQAVCVSTTRIDSIGETAELIAAIRASHAPAPAIIVGGQAYKSDPALWQRIGADAVADGARAGIAEVRRLTAGAAPTLRSEGHPMLPTDRPPPHDDERPSHEHPALRSQLLQHAHALTEVQSAVLFAIIDQEGQLFEWNAPWPSSGQPASLMELFDSGSWARLRHLLDRIAAGERDATALVHVSPQRTSETLSYRCSAISIGDGRFLLLGEPQMPLAVHEYVQVIDELSSATRQLHRARHELLHKQSRLEEALKRMSELAQMDELTRTLNRRAIMERLREEIDRAHRYGAPLTVMMIDIDHFKQVNDRFGHPEGDHVLRDVAELLRTSIRVSDQIGRYGGEEFLVLLPETTVPAAADLAERLRRTIIDATFVLGEFVQHRVTISAGLAALTDTSETIDRLLMHADNALYTAKADGRNCWRAWAPPKQSEAAH